MQYELTLLTGSLTDTILFELGIMHNLIASTIPLLRVLIKINVIFHAAKSFPEWSARQ